MVASLDKGRAITEEREIWAALSVSLNHSENGMDKKDNWSFGEPAASAASNAEIPDTSIYTWFSARNRALGCKRLVQECPSPLSQQGVHLCHAESLQRHYSLTVKR